MVNLRCVHCGSEDLRITIFDDSDVVYCNDCMSYLFSSTYRVGLFKEEEVKSMPKKKLPDYTGSVTDLERREVGRAALWIQDNPNPDFPVLAGTITTKERTFRIALWRREQKLKKPKPVKREVEFP